MGLRIMGKVFYFLSLSDTTMLINGKPFEGIADYVVY